VVVLVALAARLVQIQVVRSPGYQHEASLEQTVTVQVGSPRAPLYDRNGTPLAESVPTDDVYADDFLVEHPVTEAKALSALLGVPAAKLATELHRKSGYVLLAKQLSTATAAKLAADAFPGITLQPASHRVWPNGALAGPILGSINHAGGANGLEYQYNSLLAPPSCSQTIMASPSGVQLPQTPTDEDCTANQGTGLELTLDRSVQYQMEQALANEIVSSKALSGTAILMDTHTGDVLGMANLVATSKGASQAACSGGSPGATVVKGVAEAPCDIANDQLYEPGSVFKLVTFSAALQDGLINPTSTFSVPDQITLDHSVFHDAEQHPTEQLTATQILAQSSNIGTSEIAQLLGEQRLLAQVKQLGFGQMTSLHFPGEAPGLLADASQWEPTDLVSLPIGQVDAVSAQQVLDAYNTVANGGTFVEPRLVRANVGADGHLKATPAAATHPVIAPATNAELTAMLEQVVAQGTGTSAVVPGYAVAGKTGTSQIPTPGKDSYEAGAYMATFVGFAPANHPVLSAIIVLRRPTPIFGGTVAAPVFSQIMSYALHRYDIPTTPGAPTNAPTPTALADQGQDIT
jgi:cell division protein FtsI (penicillin-binding protein 3)